MGEVTKIGKHVLPVVPQKHARLRHQLSPADFQAIMSSDYGRESYRVLGVLIPALHDHVPVWEWEGYASQEAMDRGEYVEELDNSPTFAEIIEAFETALKVSGAGRLGKLLDLIQMGQKMQEQAAVETKEVSTPSLPDTPGENGASASPNTGTSPPTSTESTA